MIQSRAVSPSFYDCAKNNSRIRWSDERDIIALNVDWILISIYCAKPMFCLSVIDSRYISAYRETKIINFIMCMCYQFYIKMGRLSNAFVLADAIVCTNTIFLKV